MRNRKLVVLLSIVTALVLLIIICGATFLVRNIEAYNYYENSPNLDTEVLDAAGIRKNSSIFFIDEVGVKERVEKAYPNIGVVNVERRFPDRVSVNYVVYENMFQYVTADGYCQCFASGRIGSKSTAPVGGYFIVKPRDAVKSEVGAYFQTSDGYDRKMLNAIVSYLRTAALTDKQIPERIDFVDFTREGYVYIRTKAGCSLELKVAGAEFENVIDKAWTYFTDPSKSSPINKAAGTIHAYAVKQTDAEPVIRAVYDAEAGDAYYIENYIKKGNRE